MTPVFLLPAESISLLEESGPGAELRLQRCRMARTAERVHDVPDREQEAAINEAVNYIRSNPT
jgi:hypothetical protein